MHTSGDATSVILHVMSHISLRQGFQMKTESYRMRMGIYFKDHRWIVIYLDKPSRLHKALESRGRSADGFKGFSVSLYYK